MNPTHRKRLNQKQYDLLEMLYRFRFITAPLLLRLIGSKSNHLAIANSRLRILLDQDYIGRIYNGAMRVRGESAVYFLKQKGVTALKDHLGEDFLPRVGKNLLRDSSASDQFIEHWITLFDFYSRAKNNHKQMEFFTKTELMHDRYSYMPAPLPDGYIQFDETAHFFIDYIDASALYFKLTKRVKEYATYADSEQWDETGSPLPGQIIICATKTDQSRLHKKLPFMAKNLMIYTIVADAVPEIVSGAVFKNIEGDLVTLHEVISSYNAVAAASR